MAAALAGGIIKKCFSLRFAEGPLARQVYNGVISITAAAVLFLWGGVSGCSVFTAVLGIAFGLVTALQQIFNLMAMDLGAWSYTTVIVSLSMLVPALSGALLFGEKLSLMKAFGVILMCVCLVLSVKGKKEAKKATFRWFFYCMMTFLCTGGIGVMQKWHQSTGYREELNAFLLIAFGVSFIYSAAAAAVLARKAKSSGRMEKKAISAGDFAWALALVAGGCCVAVNNKLNMYLSGVMDSAVFFPLVNGGGLVLTVFAALLLFRERLTIRQWVGVGAGIAAVVFLCL